MRIANIFLIGLTTISCLGCSKQKSDYKEQFLQVFDSASNKAYLNKLDTSKWDRMYIITPYTTAPTSDKPAEFKDVVKKSGIGMRDDIILVVLTRKGVLVSNFAIDRKTLDISIPEHQIPDYFTASQVFLYKKKPKSKGFIIDGVSK